MHCRACHSGSCASLVDHEAGSETEEIALLRKLAGINKSEEGEPEAPWTMDGAWLFTSDYFAIVVEPSDLCLLMAAGEYADSSVIDFGCHWCCRGVGFSEQPGRKAGEAGVFMARTPRDWQRAEAARPDVRQDQARGPAKVAAGMASLVAPFGDIVVQTCCCQARLSFECSLLALCVVAGRCRRW